MPTPAAPVAPPPLGIRAGLEPFADALDARRAAHLLRRTSSGAPPGAVDALAGRSAAEAAGALLDPARAQPPLDAPAWLSERPPPRGATDAERQAYAQRNRAWIGEVQAGWLARLAGGDVRARMVLAWHDHFVTELRTYYHAAFAWRYLETLRTHALGDFRALVRDIGRDPAMLLYLNGVQNRAGAANENYARELLELFTMGQTGPDGTANYTEDDVREIARALTGWVVDPNTWEAVFVPRRHDDGEKTFLGRTGRFGYDDVVDVLFETRAPQIAHHLARTLYRAFVYDTPDDAVTADLADVILRADFDITSALWTLLSSAHFHDAAAVGARIKSPVDLVADLVRSLRATPDEGTYAGLVRIAAGLGQSLLDPPNVAGWPGHRAWIDTTTMPARWLQVEALLGGRRGGTDLVPLALSLHDPTSPTAAFDLPVALADYFLAVPLAELGLPRVDAPYAGDLDDNPLPDAVADAPDHVHDLVKTFLGAVPWYEWNAYSEGAPAVVRAFVRFLAARPEFQLT